MASTRFVLRSQLTSLSAPETPWRSHDERSSRLPPTPETLFDLTGRVVIVAGGAGLLGPKHAEALAGAGAAVVVADLDIEAAERVALAQREHYGSDAWASRTDITRSVEVERLVEQVMARHGRVDILVNNAANNPKVEAPGSVTFSRFEHFPIEQWQRDIDVGLTGAFLCCQIVGRQMAAKGAGVIINVASEYGIIAPDQRLYRVPGVPNEQQPTKPVSYTVVKSALIGMTKYLATYWADRGVQRQHVDRWWYRERSRRGLPGART